MALATPRQTGSSIKLFILAAALQAGVEPTDVIDGRRGCVLPIPGDPKAKPFVISGGEAGSIAPLNQQTWLSINCAFARLTQIVGLNRDRGLRRTGWPTRCTSTPTIPTSQAASHDPAVRQLRHGGQRDGADRHGVGHADHRQPRPAPRPVLRREHRQRSTGRCFTHTIDAGTQVLDAGGRAHRASTSMKGVLTRGTARSALSSFNRPADRQDGHAGRQHQLVVRRRHSAADHRRLGGRPELATRTMVNIPEFRKDGVSQGAGRHLPGEHLAHVHGGSAPPALPVLDWPEATRPTVRACRPKLYLPGVECLFQAGQRRPALGGTSPPTTTPIDGWLKTQSPPTTPPPTSDTALPTSATADTTPPPLHGPAGRLQAASRARTTIPLRTCSIRNAPVPSPWQLSTYVV